MGLLRDGTNISKEVYKYKMPKTVQQFIPIKVLYKNGMAYMGDNKYSFTFRIQDINYSSASEETKLVMNELYQECLNTLEDNVQSKITIVNRKLLSVEVNDRYLMKYKYDKYDKYRKEFNEMIEGKLSETYHTKKYKYITLTCEKKDEESAKQYFSRAQSDLSREFRKLGSEISPLNAEERLRIYHDFLRKGEEEEYNFSLSTAMKLGHDFKDYISPDSIDIQKDHLVLGNRFVKTLYITDYPNSIKDDFIEQLISKHNVIVSIDIYPVATEDAKRKVGILMDGVEMQNSRYQRNQTKNGVIPFDMPYQLKERKVSLNEFAEELSAGKQKMMFTCVTISINSATLEELNDDTDEIKSIANAYGFKAKDIHRQQLVALLTVLPFGGHKYFCPVRTLTTKGVSALMPFSVQSFQQKGGIYYGQNAVNHELILINNWDLQNFNYYIIGVSGSGKSFLTKEIISQTILSNPLVDVIIVDPEDEYKRFVEAFDGQNINISATSQNHINVMDISSVYGDGEDPITNKSEYILSFCEQIIGEKNMTGAKKSIITRCVSNILVPFRNKEYEGVNPTFEDLYDEIKKQPEPEARELLLELERYAVGTLNTFAKQTNVELNNRLVAFNIRNMSEELQPVGMLVVLDYIWNRITRNKDRGRLTLLFIDEIHLIFSHERSAAYLERMWKRVRKYGCGCCGILQNASSLKSQASRTTVTNSQFSIILNQRKTAEDLEALSELFDVNQEQIEEASNVTQGKGLIYINDTGTLLSFENIFPKDTELYKLMSTKPSNLE